MKMKLLSKALIFALLLVSTSCLKQGEKEYIPGVKGPDLNVQNGKILVSLELENIETDFGVTLPLPDLKHSTIGLTPAVHQDGTVGGTLIQVALDLKDVESDKFKVVPNETLPDGRPFPFLVEGTLPALALHVPEAFDMTFYASKKSFGFFLPIKLPAEFTGDVHFRIKVNGKSYGVASLIHPDPTTGDGAGVVVLLTLDDIRSSKSLRKLMRISKKSKNRSRIY